MVSEAMVLLPQGSVVKWRALYIFTTFLLVLTSASLLVWYRIKWSNDHPPDPEPLRSSWRKAVVVASEPSQDVSWLKEMPDDWELFHYSLEPDSGETSEERATNVGIPVEGGRRGRHALAYLKYITSNYNSLPSYTVFMDGNDRSWYQPERSVEKLDALNLTAVNIEKFVSLRCTTDPDCKVSNYVVMEQGPDFIKEKRLKPLPAFWKSLFPNDGLPEEIASTRAFQFAASRLAIQSRPVEFWQTLRQLLQQNPGEFARTNQEWSWIMDDFDGQKVDADALAAMFERLWHVFFRKPPVFCPREKYCRQTIFSNALACDDYPTGPVTDQELDRIRCTVNGKASHKKGKWSWGRFLAP